MVNQQPIKREQADTAPAEVHVVAKAHEDSDAELRARAASNDGGNAAPRALDVLAQCLMDTGAGV